MQNSQWSKPFFPERRNSVSVLLFPVLFAFAVVLSCASLWAEECVGRKNVSETELGKVALAASVIPPSRQDMDDRINRGVGFLLQSQNADGSWGKHGTTLSFQVYCEPPGGPLAFRVAVTALDVMGLYSCAPQDPRIQIALDRAEKWLLSTLPHLRQTDELCLLDFWGHTYAIQALCVLSSRVSAESQAYADLKAECRSQIDKLMKIADGGGGWGYYTFNGSSRRPNGSPTSFCTATALLALKDAEKTFGLKGEAPIIEKAIKFLYNQRTSAGSYLYSAELYTVPYMDANLHTGSLARTPACNAALYAYGHKDITLAEVRDGLETLWARGGWLDMARKKPIPHESFAKNAGYFFYYGYFYAAEDVQLLKKEERGRHYSFLSRTLLPLQETDGSWWDFPLYQYHKPYGTGFALHALARARDLLYGEGSPDGTPVGEIPS